jgi:hypothetical protein
MGNIKLKLTKNKIRACEHCECSMTMEGYRKAVKRAKKGCALGYKICIPCYALYCAHYILCFEQFEEKCKNFFKNKERKQC